VSLSNVLVLHPSVKANSLADVIALAKANPAS
jgi:tripartite-type tricarboxylate transporter receptor subunit TctC